MPFTLAHPAAILPLRRRLDVTALTCGAIAPDLEYFARLRMKSELSHSLLGLFVLDLPLALALVLVVHTLVKRPLTDALPSDALRARFHAWARAPLTTQPARWTALALAAVIGAFSHLAWDSFTHRAGFIVERSTLLSSTLALPLLGDVAVYRSLQHASTLFGLLVIALAIMRAPRAPLTDDAAERTRAARLAFALLPLVGALAALAWRHHDGTWQLATLARTYGHAIAAGCGGAGVGVVAAGALCTFLARGGRARAPDERASGERAVQHAHRD